MVVTPEETFLLLNPKSPSTAEHFPVERGYLRLTV
jgi:hypothetical protein